MTRNLIALVLCGLSLGWLMGMSLSPVVKDVLTALLSIVTTLLLAVSGLSGSTQAKNDTSFIARLGSFDALPVGVFLTFLALGSAGGNYSRTNDLLGVNQSRFINRWKTLMPAEATHEDSVQLMSHLFYRTFKINPGQKYDGNSPVSPVPDAENTSITGFYATEHSTECDELIGRSGESLRAKLRREKNPIVQRLMSKNPTDEELEQIKNELCPDSK